MDQVQIGQLSGQVRQELRPALAGELAQRGRLRLAGELPRHAEELANLLKRLAAPVGDVERRGRAREGSGILVSYQET